MSLEGIMASSCGLASNSPLEIILSSEEVWRTPTCFSECDASAGPGIKKGEAIDTARGLIYAAQQPLVSLG